MKKTKTDALDFLLEPLGIAKLLACLFFHTRCRLSFPELQILFRHTAPITM